MPKGYYAKLTEEQKEAIRARSRAYYHEHREERLTYMRERDKTNYRKANKKARAKFRQEVLDHYGGICACCGESEPRFLTLDHINGNGRAHRRTLGAKPASTALLYDLRKRGYPPEVQVLCFNCNCGRALNNGTCPHKEAGLCLTTVTGGSGTCPRCR